MDKLTFLHAGSFSGSAASLRAALAERVRVESFDLMSLTRNPGLVPARLRAHREALIAGREVPWIKTAAWSRAVQRHLERRGVLDNEPVLVLQSLPALVLPPAARYWIYTDRVGREGAAVGGPHSSRFTPGWLERETTFLSHADRVFVMGPSTQHALVAEYGIAEHKVQVIGAGPNTDLGPARTRAGASRLLFVGTQWELKGGPELLAAFKIVRSNHPELELTIVGCRPEEPLPAGARALGRVAHGGMDGILDAADILVMPTHMEAFGIALIEGLMKGLPCIGTTVGNQRWIISDAGVTVEPGDVPALAAAIRKVVDEFALFHRRAVARGSELRITMSWSRVAEHIVDELELERRG